DQDRLDSYPAQLETGGGEECQRGESVNPIATEAVRAWPRLIAGQTVRRWMRSINARIAMLVMLLPSGRPPPDPAHPPARRRCRWRVQAGRWRPPAPPSPRTGLPVGCVRR